MCEYKVVCSYDKVKRFKASAAVTASAPIHSYSGPKKPQMPANAYQRQVHSLKHLAHQKILKQ